MGVIFQKDGDPWNCHLGTHTPWAAGNDLFLTEFIDGSAEITGTVTNAGRTGIVNLSLGTNFDWGNAWTNQCYTSRLSGNRTFFQNFSGTITINGQVFTIQPKSNNQHFLLTNGADNSTSGLGLAGWTGGTFGGCTEFFATLQEVNSSNPTVTNPPVVTTPSITPTISRPVSYTHLTLPTTPYV